MGCKYYAMATLSWICLITGCSHESDSRWEQYVVEESQKDSSLTERIEYLEDRYFELLGRVAMLATNEATISTEEEHYDVAKTQLGSLLVSCKGVTPYLDGYKVKLAIGNLTAATLHGIKLTAKWRPPTHDANGRPILDWVLRQKEKVFNLTDILYPQKYTNVQFVLTPASAEEIKEITIGIETARVALP